MIGSSSPGSATSQWWQAGFGSTISGLAVPAWTGSDVNTETASNPGSLGHHIQCWNLSLTNAFYQKHIMAKKQMSPPASTALYRNVQHRKRCVLRKLALLWSKKEFSWSRSLISKILKRKYLRLTIKKIIYVFFFQTKIIINYFFLSRTMLTRGKIINQMVQ